MCAWAGESKSRCDGSKKYHCDIYANAIYYTYNSIMNDKFMCLCFPEFSGKYVCDDVMCFYTTFFSAALGSLLSGAEAEKSSIQTLFVAFASIILLPPPLPTSALITEAGSSEHKFSLAIDIRWSTLKCAPEKCDISRLRQTNE